MIRLLVNAGGKKAGSEVDPADLGDAFVQELLAAGQAIAVEPVDPAEPILIVISGVFESGREIAVRLQAAIDEIEGWSEADRARIANAIVDGLSAGWVDEIRGLSNLLDLADAPFGRMSMVKQPLTAEQLAVDEGFRVVENLIDRARIGEALMEVLPKGYTYNDCPSEIVVDLQNRIDELEAEVAKNTDASGPGGDSLSDQANAAGATALAGGTAGAPSTGTEPVAGNEAAAAQSGAASTDNPPTVSEPSGDAGGAPPPPAEPAAPKPARARSGRAARTPAG